MKSYTKKGIGHYAYYLVAIALFLVAILLGTALLERPAAVHAATQKEYVSEIKVITTEGGTIDQQSKKLESEGYKIDTAQNLLAEFDGEPTYLAYKTTADPNNAITDISLMNMKGPYSFAAYENLIEEAKEMAQERIDLMASGIKAFRENYEAEAPAALQAYELMNKYLEEDSNQLMGDFYLKTPIDTNLRATDNALRDMVMQCDPIILNTLDKCLAIGSAPQNEETSWLDKLSALSSTAINNAKGNTTLADKAELLYDACLPVSIRLRNYHDFYGVIFKEFSAETQVQLDEKMKDPVKKARFDELVNNYYPEDKKGEYTTTSFIYLMLSLLPYNNDGELDFDGRKSLIVPKLVGGSLLDLFMLIADDEFEFSALYPMATVISDAQANMAYLSGMETIIMLGDNSEANWEETDENLDKVTVGGVKPKDFEVISVYSGVDRTIYNPDGIALTDEAVRRQYVAVNDTWYTGNLDEISAWILRGVLGALAVTTIGMGVKLAQMLKTRMIQPSVISNECTGFLNITQGLDDSFSIEGQYMTRQGYEAANKAAGVRDAAFGTKWSMTKGFNFAIAFTVVMFVFLIVMTVFLCYEFGILYQTPTYTEKPRIIFHNYADENGISHYIRYDAVVDQKGEICDLRTTKTEWVVLYTTKDKKAGYPIVANSLKGFYSSGDTIGKDLKPVHRIGEKTAYDIQYKSFSRMYFKNDPQAYPSSTASTFSAGAFTLALCGGILGGAILGWIATWFILKRKNKNIELLKNQTPKAGA